MLGWPNDVVGVHIELVVPLPNNRVVCFARARVPLIVVDGVAC